MARNLTQKYELVIGVVCLLLAIICESKATNAETTNGETAWEIVAGIFGVNALVCAYIWLREKNEKDEPAQ
jgi:uncharacterized membrane protein YdcZ (DUF606 family)